MAVSIAKDLDWARAVTWFCTGGAFIMSLKEPCVVSLAESFLSSISSRVLGATKMSPLLRGLQKANHAVWTDSSTPFSCGCDTWKTLWRLTMSTCRRLLGCVWWRGSICVLLQLLKQGGWKVLVQGIRELSKLWQAVLALTHCRFDLIPTGHVIVYNISLSDKKKILNYYLFWYFIIVGEGLYIHHFINIWKIKMSDL